MKYYFFVDAAHILYVPLSTIGQTKFCWNEYRSNRIPWLWAAVIWWIAWLSVTCHLMDCSTHCDLSFDGLLDSLWPAIWWIAWLTEFPAIWWIAWLPVSGRYWWIAWLTIWIFFHITFPSNISKYTSNLEDILPRLLWSMQRRDEEEWIWGRHNKVLHQISTIPIDSRFLHFFNILFHPTSTFTHIYHYQHVIWCSAVSTKLIVDDSRRINV